MEDKSKSDFTFIPNPNRDNQTGVTEGGELLADDGCNQVGSEMELLNMGLEKKWNQEGIIYLPDKNPDERHNYLEGKKKDLAVAKNDMLKCLERFKTESGELRKIK